MKELLEDEYEDYLRSFEAGSYKALRLNPLKAEEAQLLVLLNRHIKVNGRVPWEPLGYYYNNALPGKNPLHEAGMYYIQEPSAMKPVALMFEEEANDLYVPGVTEGIRVLDLCAAPGGKSTQAAAYMRGRGVLVCNEIIPKRAKILSENIERMGVRNAVVLNESPGRLSEVFTDYFDKILVDAPCSGEGMFRKDEKAVLEWSYDNVIMCAGRQEEILDCAASMLRPGGTLVYSTCTFSKEEDEECIEGFLKRHGDYRLIRQEKLFPHRIKGEGHFVAELERMNTDVIFCMTGDMVHDTDREYTGYCAYGAAVGVDIKEYLAICTDTDRNRNEGRNAKRKGNAERKVFREFCMETLSESGINGLNGRLEWFGDNLYLMPEGAPGIDGLRVERPGLQLGTFKKDRFEPAHALALALTPREASRTVNITLEQADAYIAGMTLDAGETDRLGDKAAYVDAGTESADGLRGWVLVCCEGISLGWGKAVDGIIKNHYPKGLRKRL